MNNLQLVLYVQCLYVGREYLIAKAQFQSRRRPRHIAPSQFTGFSEWLARWTDDSLRNGLRVEAEVALLAQHPSRRVIEYNSMYAYGDHYRCANVDDEDLHVTFDSGVTAIFTQMCRSSARDPHPVEALLKYVGIVQGIMVVQYGPLERTVMRCSWIRPNLHGTPTMKKDRNGLWLVKFWSRELQEREPYVFPANVNQVCEFIRKPCQQHILYNILQLHVQ